MGVCPFCRRVSSGVFVASNADAAAIEDAYPLNPGHLLVISRAHVADYFALDAAVQAAMWQLVAELKKRLDGERSPAGYTVGMNVGKAAGQTVAHAHIHLIPRVAGDVPDPRGGVRWVIPARAPYWEK